MATKVIRFELADGPREVSGLDGYLHAVVLFCWNGTPLGRVRIEVRDGRVDASDLWWAASAAIGKSLAPAVVDQLLGSLPMAGPDPQATVVITTHDRAEDLLRCLNAVIEHTPPQAEILVIDNARRTIAQPRSRRTIRCDTSSSGAREPAGDGVSVRSRQQRDRRVHR